MAAIVSIQAQIRLLQNEIAIRAARERFLAYVRLMSEHPQHDDDYTQSSYVTKAHHEYLAGVFEGVERGDYDGKIVLISLPPRAGKSHLAKAFVGWYSGRNPHKHCIYSTYNDDFAKDIGVEVRNLMLTKRHREVFKDFKFQKGGARSDYMVTYKKGQIKFAGEGGSITGKGGHCLIVDDLFKNDVEADSLSAREKKWAWFNRTFKTRVMDDKSPIIFIATRWHEDDVIGRMTDPESPFYDPRLAKRIIEINIPSIAFDNDPLGRKEGEVLWPERFGKDFLEGMRAADPRGFNALYQGRPTPENGEQFKREWAQYYTRKDLPRKLRIYAASDHAISTDQKRDYTVLLIAGVDEDDNIYVLDVVWARLDARQAIENMVSLMRKWKPLVWWAEKGHITRSIGPFLRKRMIEEAVYCRIEDVTPVSDKVARAQSIIARMSMKKVFFPRHQEWVQRAFDQFVKFPNATHDDFVDAISWLGLELTRLLGPSRKAKRRPENDAPVTGSIAWVKWAHNQKLKQDQRRKIMAGF